MTLEEAIKHYKEVTDQLIKLADKWEAEGGSEYGKTMACKRCAEEHRQLAEWLKLLKRILDSGDCNDCAMLHSQCRYAPKWGEQVRYNCPFYSRGED